MRHVGVEGLSHRFVGSSSIVGYQRPRGDGSRACAVGACGLSAPCGYRVVHFMTQIRGACYDYGGIVSPVVATEAMLDRCRTLSHPQQRTRIMGLMSREYACDICKSG